MVSPKGKAANVAAVSQGQEGGEEGRVSPSQHGVRHIGQGKQRSPKE